MSLKEPSTLRDRQRECLERMLNLNADTPADTPVWKALVLDTRSQAIVSSTMRVNDLLRCGITVHSLINAPRAALPDVPAVYFVEPTVDNIRHIVADIERDTYAAVYVNFTSALPRALLEEFAKKVAVAGKAARVAQVYDQCADFVVTEPDLFALELPGVYRQFTSAVTTEAQIDTLTSQIAAGLFDVLSTLGSMPVIRCPSGGPAEFVATKLDARLRDHVANTKGAQPHRPVLILLDRSFDLRAMLAHSWIYQCMISDVFALARNTITLTETKDGARTVRKYDVDPGDFFWAANAALPFPDAVENVERELAAYKARAQAVTAADTDVHDLDGARDTARIQHAILVLPELAARKNIIDMHMNVLAALLAELETRKLDRFFEIEQGTGPKTQAQFWELVQDTAAPVSDKLRTFMVLTLGTDLPAEYVTKCEAALEAQGADLAALRHVRRAKELTKMSRTFAARDVAPAPAGALSGLSSRLMGLTDGGLLTEGVGSLLTGLKRLLPENSNMPITDIVESIMEPSSKPSAATDGYLYFDPKMARGGATRQPVKISYADGIVFVVGGGNYLEYQNLKEWTAGKHGQTHGTKHVVYGSTAVVSAEEFLTECAELGN
ncbi:hypothetical protein BABINDRAFT_161145 [Babjeviella inositovora NRRL Y-12698]|uniref:SLY1 protein n=1 Tax=Babjeviella inositovora NRRL Y-12698 TaxID=984486 RepID=A0A1E3QR24_9ASCO|nr:uncharacterized protein BABINDRAFT_161145 [Babjeviella inositovora NRRL Y-12698]ODQ80166.1 hypothetical protein BABINDRAFT_161145 [Babjeviella inositovora NRRL Y-12698]